MTESSDVVLGGDEAAALSMYQTDEAWFGVSGDALTGPVTSLEAPEMPSGQAPAAVSMSDAKAALEAEGPSVLSWRTADLADVQGQWRELREFVEWTVEVYQLETSEHRPCWWRHPWIVQEWLGLWHLHRLSWSGEDAGSGPNNFNYWLHAGRGRLVGAWGKSTCSPQRHEAPRQPMTVFTDASAEEWADVTGVDVEQGTYEAPSQWPAWRGMSQEGVA